MSHVLDNPVWHALTGPQADVGLGHSRGRHFPRDAAPLSPIESSDSVALADLAKGFPASTEARSLGLSDEPLPPVLWHKLIAVQA